MMETLTHSYIGNSIKILTLCFILVFTSCSEKDDEVRPRFNDHKFEALRKSQPLQIEGTYRHNTLNTLVPNIVEIRHHEGNLITVNQDTARLINPHRFRGINPSQQLDGTYANGILNLCRVYIDSSTQIDYYICQTLRK